MKISSTTSSVLVVLVGANITAAGSVTVNFDDPRIGYQGGWEIAQCSRLIDPHYTYTHTPGGQAQITATFSKFMYLIPDEYCRSSRDMHIRVDGQEITPLSQNVNIYNKDQVYWLAEFEFQSQGAPRSHNVTITYIPSGEVGDGAAIYQLMFETEDGVSTSASLTSQSQSETIDPGLRSSSTLSTYSRASSFELSSSSISSTLPLSITHSDGQPLPQASTTSLHPPQSSHSHLLIPLSVCLPVGLILLSTLLYLCFIRRRSSPSSHSGWFTGQNAHNRLQVLGRTRRPLEIPTPFFDNEKVAETTVSVGLISNDMTSNPKPSQRRATHTTIIPQPEPEVAAPPSYYTS